MHNFRENLLCPLMIVNNFRKIYANIGVDRQFDNKKGSLSRLTPESAVAKTVFGLNWPRSPHNLG